MQLHPIAHRMGAIPMLNNIYKILVPQFFKAGIYVNADVAYFVQLGWLTGQDFKDITGDDYVAPTNS